MRNTYNLCKIKTKLVIFISIIFFNCQINLGQTLITENFDKTPLSEVLKILTNKYGIKLAYDNSIVEEINISANIKSKTIEQALKIILPKNGLEYMMINNVWIINKIKTKDSSKTTSSRSIGIIRDKRTGETLPYAKIQVEEKKITTMASAEGIVILPSEDNDSVHLRVEYTGFEPLEIKLSSIDLLNNRNLILELNPVGDMTTDTIIIRRLSTIIEIGDRPGEIIINTRNLHYLPLISTLDVLSPLTLTSGTDATFESLSGLNVRHSSSDKNLITYDGFNIYHIDHMFGAMSAFNCKAIKDVRIYRNGPDATFGGKTSSMIEISGKDGNTKNLSIQSGIDMLSANFIIDGPIGNKFTYLLAARKSITDYFKSDFYYKLSESIHSDIILNRKKLTAFSSDTAAPNTSFYDANAKFTFKKSPYEIFSLSGYIADDKLKYQPTNINKDIYESSTWSTKGIGFKWSKQWNELLNHRFIVGLSKYDMRYLHDEFFLRRRTNQRLRDTISRFYNISNKLFDANFNLLFTLKLNEINAFETGIQLNLINIKANEKYLQTNNSNIIADTSRTNNFIPKLVSSWLQYTFSKGIVKALTAGIRVSKYNITNQYYIEPRTQLLLSFSPTFTFKSTAGIYQQFVSKITQDGASYRNIWIAANNKNFPVTKTDNLMVGFTYRTKDSSYLDLEIYRKNTKGLISMQNIFQTSGNNRIKQISKIYDYENKAYGIDIITGKKWSSLETWIAYSISKSINHSEEINGGENYPAIDDHLHELKIGTVYHWRRYFFSATWIYGSPRPWDELIFSSRIQLSSDYQKNSSRLPAYHRLDIAANMYWKLKKSFIEIGLKGFNIYNNQNIIAKTYTLTDTPILDYLQGRSFITYNENKD